MIKGGVREYGTGERKCVKNTGKKQEKYTLFIFTKFYQNSQYTATFFLKERILGVKITKVTHKVHTLYVLGYGEKQLKRSIESCLDQGNSWDKCTKITGQRNVKNEQSGMWQINVHFPGLPLDFSLEK